MNGTRDGWFLPRPALNEPQIATLERFLPHAGRAHEIDCKIRKDGVETWYEFDFIKHMVTAAATNEDGREVVAAWMILRGYATGHGDSIQSLLFELEAQAQKIGPNGPPPGRGDIDLAIQRGLSKFDLSMAWEVRSAITDAVLEMLRPTAKQEG